MLQEAVDAINKAARQATQNMHTALPGEILKFDPAKCMADVQPKQKFKKPDGKTIDFPKVTDVPVIFPRCKSCDVQIAWPVKPGDGCLLIFAEAALDYWLYGKETPTVLEFDLSNAIAITGLYPESNDAVKKADADTAVVVKNKDTLVEIKPVEIFVKAQDVKVKGNVKVDGDTEVTAKSKIILKNGGTTLSVKQDEVLIEGNLTVTGQIKSGG